MKRITFLALIAIVIYLLIERDRQQQEGVFWRKRVEGFEARDRQRAEQDKRDEQEAKLYLQFLDEYFADQDSVQLTAEEEARWKERSKQRYYESSLRDAQYELWVEEKKSKGD